MARPTYHISLRDTDKPIGAHGRSEFPDTCSVCRAEKITDHEERDTHVVDVPVPASDADHSAKLTACKRICKELNLAAGILVAINEVDGSFRVSLDYAINADHPLAFMAIPAAQFLKLAITMNIEALVDGFAPPATKPGQGEVH